MNLSDPQLVSVASTMTVAASMIWLGLKHELLEQRTPPRRCPACGRLLGAGRSCACRD